MGRSYDRLAKQISHAIRFMETIGITTEAPQIHQTELFTSHVITSYSIHYTKLYDTQFWIVRPQLSASSIQGLDTILSGSYVGIQIGTSKEPRREFNGLSSAPPVSPETPGLP